MSHHAGAKVFQDVSRQQAMIDRDNKPTPPSSPLTADTANFALIKRLNSSMMQRLHFATGSSTLRHKGLRLWAKDSPEALAVRKKYSSDLSALSDKSDASDPYSLKTAYAEVAANTLICLINQASYLLGRQLRRLEEQFIEEGGFAERLYKVRVQARKPK